MVDAPTGRFSAHFEYEQPRALPMETFPYLRDALTTDPLDIAALRLPQIPEPARHGADGVDCRECTAEDHEYLWTDERWRVHTVAEPQPLYFVLINPPAALRGPARPAAGAGGRAGAAAAADGVRTALAR